MGKQYDFLSCTDLHFTSRVPACRKPVYELNALNKFYDILRNANKTKFKVLLCAGDFFDSATKNIGFFLMTELIHRIQEFPEVNIYVVPGNHDLRFHSFALENTPLMVLAAACPNFHVYSYNTVPIKKDILLFTAGWNHSMVELLQQFDHDKEDETPENDFDYLVTLHHVTMFENRRAAWADDRDSYLAEEYVEDILAEVPQIDFAITGDNHERFTYSIDNEFSNHTILVNSGCMMRGKVDLINYVPHYAGYYRKVDGENAVDLIPYRIDADVFNMQYVTEQREIKAATHINFDELVEEVNSAVNITLDYPTALRHVVNSKHPELKERLNLLLENL